MGTKSLVYIANQGNPNITDRTEEHITRSFVSQGWEVTLLREEQASIALNDQYDLLLIHHWNAHNRLNLIERINAKIKVFWNFDKVWNRRDITINENLSVCDYGFMVDGTWTVAQNNSKLYVLRQGVGQGLYNMGRGKYKPKQYPGKIAFTGNLYGNRIEWAKQINDRFHLDFICYENTHDRDLFDLCATVKIVVAPQYPCDDNYWGNRVYLILGAGGFLIHPYCAELAKEFVDGDEIVFYNDMNDLLRKIDFYLEAKHSQLRETIQANGYKKMAQYTFNNRVKSLLEIIYDQSYHWKRFKV